MKFNSILMMLILGLLVWLLIDNFNQIDFALTKNNSIISAEKSKINNYQNIDTVKKYTNLKLDLIKQNRINNSLNATKRLEIIVAIIILLIIFIISFKWQNIKNLK